MEIISEEKSCDNCKHYTTSVCNVMDGIVCYQNKTWRSFEEVAYMTEFIEYLKNNKVAIKFDNKDDKLNFCKKFGREDLNDIRYNIIYEDKKFNGYDDFRCKEDGYRIINYKDIKIGGKF